MKIVCAIEASDLLLTDVDILVLPEGVSLEAIQRASARFPRAVVVGAARDGNFMRAYAMIGEENKIDYLKIGTDGRSIGVNLAPKNAMLECENFAVGVLVCMDVQHRFQFQLRESLNASSKPTRIMCIPADMDPTWFSSDVVLGFGGAYVAMCNNNTTYPVLRARSLIAGPDGRCIVKQELCEAISAVVT
jgi:hypothetical protein